MWPAVRVAVCSALFVYVGLFAALYLFQRSLLYHPRPLMGAEFAPLITLPVKDAKVTASAREMESKRALIYFGGNAEDASLNMPSFSATFPDSAIYLMHYRGYGGSSGSPSEAALCSDALVLFDEAQRNHTEITVLGRSLGSGIAVYVASLRPVSRLVLVTPFDSVVDVGSRHLPFFPVSWLARDRYESWRYAPKVTAPTVILAADQDEIVPRASTELLLSRFKPGVATLTVIAGDHNSISANPEYLPRIKGR